MEGSLLIDIVLWTMYVLLAVAIAAALWSAVHGVMTHERTDDTLAARHTSMLGYATTAGVAVTLLVTFLFGSTQPVVSNGQPFTDTLWLRLTDMFIYTSLILICLCSVIVGVAKCRR